MTQLKRNVVANLLGRGWSVFMALAFIPFYIRAMGIEAYGLVGFYATLQAVFALSDMGLSTTLNRWLARATSGAALEHDSRDLVRTLEIPFWLASAAVGVVVIALAPAIANHWVHPEHLATAAVTDAVRLMGLVILLQLPFAFYSGGLLGLQRQVLNSALTALWYTLRFAGGAAALWLVKPTVVVFFSAQVIATAVCTLVVREAVWRSLPARDGRPRFRLTVLRAVGRYAIGASGIAITALLLQQSDKLLLSKLLTLEMLGYYSLAWLVASGLTNLTIPLFNALFPRFSQHVARGDVPGLTALYHRSCQLMSALLLPAAIVLAFFSRELLLLWTKNETTTSHTSLIVTLLVVGTLMNGLTTLPFALQMAYGWTSLPMATNVVSIAVLCPLLVGATLRYGGAGAAATWLALNAGYLVVLIPLMHRRLLRGELWTWYKSDIGVPAVGVFLFVGAARLTLPHLAPGVLQLALIAAVYAGACAVALLLTPAGRSWLARLLQRARTHARLPARSRARASEPAGASWTKRP